MDVRQSGGLPFQLPGGHGRGLEMAKGQPGKMETQDREEGADRGCRAAVCTHMSVGCARVGGGQGALSRWAGLSWMSVHVSVSGQLSEPPLGKSAGLQEAHRGHTGVGLRA